MTEPEKKAAAATPTNLGNIVTHGNIASSPVPNFKLKPVKKKGQAKPKDPSDYYYGSDADDSEEEDIKRPPIRKRTSRSRTPETKLCPKRSFL